MPFTRAARFPRDDEARALLNGFKERHREFVCFHLPIGHHCAQNLIDGDFVRDLNFYNARCALRYLETYFGVDGGRVFAEAQELRQRSPHSQRKRGAMVLSLPAPSKLESLVSAPVGSPLALRRGL